MRINLKKQIKKNPFLLAPMDAVTDIAFREIAEINKASYTCSELTSVEALIRDKTFDYRYMRGNLKINCVQLFGSVNSDFKSAVEIVDSEADVIDINFGCPSSRVMGNESGSILLKDPSGVSKIVNSVINSTNKPVSAKIRLGYKKQNYIEIAKEIEDCGVDLITLHGRTAKQKYSGRADWDAISKLYSELRVPFIGNGDIKNEEDVDKYLGSHCDGLMIGRAAIGNPLIFKKLYHYWKRGEKLEIEDIKEEQKKLFSNYIKTAYKYEFNKIDFKIMQQAMWFMKGIPGTKNLRKEIAGEKDVTKILECINKF